MSADDLAVSGFSLLSVAERSNNIITETLTRQRV